MIISSTEYSIKKTNTFNFGKELLNNKFFHYLIITGQYKIHELDKVMVDLHEACGKIAKVGGLLGHPDLLFVFDGDEIRNIFKKEEVLPHRPAMPSLHHWKANMRADFFGETAGVIGV